MPNNALVTPQQEWDLYQADPRALFENISSGLRKSVVSCQYFVSNLPKICGYWDASTDPGTCTYGADPETETGTPSGYGGPAGSCDFLGRRNWCDKYTIEETETETEDTPGEELWFCCAPDPYRTGLTKLVNPIPEAKDTTVRSLLKSEILGYCEEEGVGKCDGEGCGRGCDAPVSLSELVKLPIVCTYYKPWRMGFGAIEPQSYKSAIKEYGMIYEDAYENFTKNRRLGKRLPIQFEIYNMRAQFQKCMWWAGFPFQFVYQVIDGENDVITFVGYPNTNCTCTNSQSTPFHSAKEFDSSSQQWLLREAWSDADTIICNGAKPECPCYTGRWQYCLDNRMYPGMKITAYQILELRFWTYPWQTQEQYDRFFENRPNWSDPTTSAIFTFTRWEKGAEDAVDGTLMGRRFNLVIDGNSNGSCKLLDYSIKSDYNIENSEVAYAKYGIEGTTTEDQVTYPTLVRALWDFSNKTLIVTYPYSSGLGYCEVRSNLPNHCYITSVGYTEQAVRVYFINSSFAETTPPKYINKYQSVLDIPQDELELFYIETKSYIDSCITKFPNYSVSTVSSSDGVYIARLLRVEYNDINNLFIIVDCGNSTYLFEKRQVFPRFGGGTINQTFFNYNLKGDNYLPETFMPSATAGFVTKTIGCAKGVSVSVVSSYSPLESAPVYTYSLDWVKLENVKCNKWSTIGSTYYLWVDLEDVNLNYVFRWEFISGSVKATDYKDNSYTFDLEVVFPLLGNSEITLDGSEIKNNNLSGVSATIERISVPPSTLILKPKKAAGEKDPLGFGGMKTIDIVLSYQYLKLTTAMSDRLQDNIVFPTGGVTFINNPLGLKASGDSWEVTGVRAMPMCIMGLFIDNDGRYISAFATKLYTNVQNVYCRSIEIYYKYTAEGQAYELMPTLGAFATYRGNPKRIGTRTHSEIAPCGDHECGDPCIGPMWFPYKRCDETKRYNFKTAPGFCFMPYNGEGAEKYEWRGGWVWRPDYRYCLTKHYEAWSGFASPLATCRVPWQLYYSKKQAGSDIFAGYANIVSWVSEKTYIAEGWAMPPFGNYARDFVDRYMSTDHCAYYWENQATGIKKEKWAWVPAVLDNRSFYFSFNCFDTYSNTNAQDCFSFVDQMTFLLGADIGEKIICEENSNPDTGETIKGNPYRFSWDEIFKVEGIAAYFPKPIVVVGESIYGYYYSFTDDSLAWAWQEEWLDIIREYKAQEEEEAPEEDILKGKLSFLKLLKPSYKYDDMKKQHRLICEEGHYEIIFVGPEYEEGIVTKLPSLTLVKVGTDDFSRARYFNIIYDKYEAIPIEWNDEGDGEGSTGNNIYEMTGESPWINYENMLFIKDESSFIEEEERTYYVADMFGWTKNYYNRGIIINMLQSDLLNLPTDETATPYEVVSSTLVEEEYILKGVEESLFATRKASHIIKLSLGDEGGLAISRIVVKGKWGFAASTEKGVDDIYISKPSIETSCLTIGGKTVAIGSLLEVTPLSLKANAAERSSLVDYTVEIKAGLTPKYIIEDRLVELTLTFVAFQLEGLCVTSVELFNAEYSSSYKEGIYVFEQKFIASELNTAINTDGLNLDGPVIHLSTRENVGPVLPPYTSHSNELKTANKLRGFWGSEKYEYPLGLYAAKLPLAATVDNLYDIELEEQKKIYESTLEREVFGDSLLYTFVTPYVLQSSAKKGIYGGLVPTNFLCKSNKLLWKDNSLAAGYIKYAFWSPGGHYWDWSPGFEKVKCYIYGSKTWEIYSQRLVHVLHSGGSSPAMDPIYVYYNGAAVYANLVEMFTGL